jgi:hypothetical protein
MDHIAIMTKKWKLIPKILTKTKTLESRWYVNKIAPWDKIKPKDTIYFKNSGEPVSAKATVKSVLQFSNLDRQMILEIYKSYAHAIGVEDQDVTKYVNGKLKKNYCILIGLTDPQELKPFNINKKGFGIACAWLCVDNISKLISRPGRIKH